MQMERSCDGDGLGPARDVERVESNTGGIMKRVRFVQFYAILQFGTMGSIFMNLVLDLDFLSMEVITCEPPLELVSGTFKNWIRIHLAVHPC